MSVTERELQSLVERAEEQERRARLRAVIYSLIPIIIAGLLLWLTATQVQQSNLELEKSQSELASVNEKLDQTQEQVDRTQEDLEYVTIQLEQAHLDLEDAQVQLEQSQARLDDSNRELMKTQNELEESRAQLSESQREVEELQKRVDDLNKALEEITEQLQIGTTLLQYRVTFDPVLTEKRIAAYSFDIHNLFSSIINMQEQGVGWKSGGVSPEEGFDSPGFAAYILGQQGLIQDPIYEVRYSLQRVLPASNLPNVGDVVFYESGYTMFYFMDENAEPFVIGMTPRGILALQVNFAPVLGYAAGL